ncbi:hypothetical protein DFH29DRAFT_920240 [Suillus ampliporus]|nr:hypothetical protein DFH29DRAFT_920240 [Suillus ampliporus]
MRYLMLTFYCPTASHSFCIMGGSQSRVQNHHHREHTVTSSRPIFKSWSPRHRRKKQRRHSRNELSSPVEREPAPWVGGHKVFVALEDGQGLIVSRDAL